MKDILGLKKTQGAKVTFEQETAGIGSPLYDKNGAIIDNEGIAPIILLPAQQSPNICTKLTLLLLVLEDQDSLRL